MRILFSSLLFLVATSCSAKSEDTKLNDIPGFCSEWAMDACNGTVTSLCGSTTASCLSAQQTFCESIVPTAKYTPAGAPQCLKAVTAAYKDGTLTADERDTVLRLGNDCAAILSGPGETDSPCGVTSDCDTTAGLSCVTKGLDTTGSCRIPVMVGPGLSCSEPDQTCSAGFYCDGQHCVGGNPAGDACSAAVPCGAGSHCVAGGADGGVTGSVCVTSVTTGSCDSDVDCAARLCSVPAGATTGRCVSNAPPLAATDQLCANLGS